MAWIASAKPVWRNGEGRPNLVAIEDGTGVPYSTLWRLGRNHGVPVGTTNVRGLTAGAAEAHGVPPLVAFCRICQIPDLLPDDWFKGADTPAELVAAFKSHVSAFDLAGDLEASAA